MRIAALLAFAAVLAAVLGVATSQGAIPRFAGEIAPVTWNDLRHSYRAGCPVGPAQLRVVRVGYWGFDGRSRRGSIVVSRRVAADVVEVFRKLWAARFPIRRLQPVSVYRGSDDASMEADNTSGFNCRVIGGTSRWSMHAYGEAIDVNPVENPYVQGSRVSPPAGRAYVDRYPYRPGMALADGVLVRAFASVGWKWGDGYLDYQHFSTTGR
ncbi:MAG TPA: M15 family metallopeptidase [Gaiellaceae bacterium]|nr:M15 family metallopeptidase [Gaiellaceae bacterium]